MPIADVEPDAPTTLSKIDAQTTETQVSFSWSAPANDGGDAVIDYSIEMDDNNDDVFTEVASAVTDTSYTHTGVTAGETYRFRVRARNSVGFSPYSDVFTIAADTETSVIDELFALDLLEWGEFLTGLLLGFFLNLTAADFVDIFD